MVNCTLRRKQASAAFRYIGRFEPGDRYRYDFDLCTCARRWAQVDTAQDASWFGTWASLAEEFAAALRGVDRWNRQYGYGSARIDPGFDPALKAAFEVMGLGEMLH